VIFPPLMEEMDCRAMARRSAFFIAVSISSLEKRVIVLVYALCNFVVSACTFAADDEIEVKSLRIVSLNFVNVLLYAAFASLITLFASSYAVLTSLIISYPSVFSDLGLPLRSTH